MKTRLTKNGDVFIEMTEFKAIVIAEAIEKMLKQKIYLDGAERYVLEELMTLIDDVVL